MEEITKEMLIEDVMAKYPQTEARFEDFFKRIRSDYDRSQPIESSAELNDVELDTLLNILNTAIE